jgi:hypothetical protein
MTPENNIEFLKQQREAALYLSKQTQEKIEIQNSYLKNENENLYKLRVKIQDIKKELLQDNRIPPISRIRTIVEKQELLRRTENVLQEFSIALEEEESLCLEFKKILEQEAEIPKDMFSDRDKEKIEKLKTIFYKNISEFEFESYDPKELEISLENYRPTIHGFQMYFDVSASDNIRLIWAYTLALLEVSNQTQGNQTFQLDERNR